MKHGKKILGLLVAILAINNNSNAALVITGQAFDTASMALENGSPLMTGRVEMGYYTVTPTALTFSSYTSASQFTSNFVSVSGNSMGIDAGIFYDSLFSTTIEVPTGIATYSGKQFYILVGNGSLLSNSTQIGVYSKSTWVVPTNPTGPTPDAVVFEMSSLLSSDVLFGSYSAGNGAYQSDGVVNSFNLQTVVPEPSTGALLMIGSVGLVALRRLRKV